MSDSDDLSTPANIPPEAEIEACLRRIVQSAIGKDEITVNSARLRAEQELGLDEGFFKGNERWKQLSKTIINQAFQDPESPEKLEQKVVKRTGAKRKSEEIQPAQKKVKTSQAERVSREVLTDDVSKSSRAIQPSHSQHTQDRAKRDEESSLSEPPEDHPDTVTIAKKNGDSTLDDESDLSSVIDDPPPKRRPQKKSSSPRVTNSKAKNVERPPKAAAQDKAKDLTPDEEEIKRLQSWLLKCGVRKLWHRELAPFTSATEKIRHLKKMLEDVGMTPRYSAEKARQIKEARELKQELEAAREFNEQWGDGDDVKNCSDGEGKKAREEVKLPPRRARPKGLVDFGDSDEDSD